MLDRLAQFAAPWNEMYSDSPVISTLLVFVHLGAIMIAAGTAFRTDRRALRCVGAQEDRPAYLRSAVLVHRSVIRALAVVIVAGVLLFLADVEALAQSPIFRTKLVLIALLLGNGLAIMQVEKRLRIQMQDTPGEHSWRPLAMTARLSQILWVATILAGIALRNV